ncbi:MAG: NfeD family protein [Pseudomonadota bacterium]
MELFLITHWHWLIIAGVLLVVEVLSGTAMFLWLGAACAGVAAVVFYWPGLIWQYQIAFAALFIILSIFLWKLWGKLFPAGKRQDNHSLNRRSEQYVGRLFNLSEPIVNGIGKIKVDDSSWRVSGKDAPINTQVEVVAAEGMLLKVKAVDDSAE